VAALVIEAQEAAFAVQIAAPQVFAGIPTPDHHFVGAHKVHVPDVVSW
jgi:hypothetical protein